LFRAVLEVGERYDADRVMRPSTAGKLMSPNVEPSPGKARCREIVTFAS
jgi:hypothetical protein